MGVGFFLYSHAIEAFLYSYPFSEVYRQKKKMPSNRDLGKAGH